MSLPHMGVNPDALRPINDLHIAIFTVYDCYGEECGRAFPDAEGNLMELPPHRHTRWSDPNGGWQITACEIADDCQLPRVVDPPEED